MNFDFTPEDRPPQRIFSAAKELVVALIFCTDDRSEQKERIMIAREEALLSDAEAENLIARHGLADA